MKLLLKEDVPNLGFCGDEVEVKDGYGRNYLVPQGKALLATPENVKAFRHQKSVVQARMRKLKTSAEETSEKMSGMTCEFVKKVGDQGKLFGSVTSQEIAQFLIDNGFEVDRRKIQLPEPIKTLGEHIVDYKLHKEVAAKIKIKVIQAETQKKVLDEGAQETPASGESGEEPKKENV